MATKTFIFMGYSLRDSDFREIWDSITSSLGRFGRTAYAINPNASEENISFWSDRGVQTFKTSDLQFARYLREKLERDGYLPTRELLAHLQAEHSRLLDVHIATKQNSDGGMASSMYQDGLLHVLDEILTSTALGTKRQADFDSDLVFTQRTLRDLKQADDVIEIAYWSGRKVVYEHYCNRDLIPIPAYFHPYRLTPSKKLSGNDIWSDDSSGSPEQTGSES